MHRKIPIPVKVNLNIYLEPYYLLGRIIYNDFAGYDYIIGCDPVGISPVKFTPPVWFMVMGGTKC